MAIVLPAFPPARVPAMHAETFLKLLRARADLMQAMQRSTQGGRSRRQQEDEDGSVQLMPDGTKVTRIRSMESLMSLMPRTGK
jgi:hypothetical protein